MNQNQGHLITFNRDPPINGFIETYSNNFGGKKQEAERYDLPIMPSFHILYTNNA